MTGDEQSTSGMVRPLVEEYIRRLGATTEWLNHLPNAAASSADPGALALPGALSAAQITWIADGIAAQRRSIAALKAQLSSFDEQLAALEQILGPLAEWSRAWADLEQRLVKMSPVSGGGT